VATEIERKYLLPGIPTTVDLGPGTPLRQGYLALDGEVALRVRITADRCVLTVKAGSGRARTEVERDLTRDEAESLWPHTVGRRIEKTRHRVPIGDGVVAEVDQYHGDLDGLATVEVEFPDLAAADGFVAPAWFGRDVTEEPGWTNAALALHGRPTATD
jgi:CYTH domain-containing protein